MHICGMNSALCKDSTPSSVNHIHAQAARELAHKLTTRTYPRELDLPVPIWHALLLRNGPIIHHIIQYLHARATTLGASSLRSNCSRDNTEDLTK